MVSMCVEELLGTGIGKEEKRVQCFWVSSKVPVPVAPLVVQSFVCSEAKF